MQYLFVILNYSWHVVIRPYYSDHRISYIWTRGLHGHGPGPKSVLDPARQMEDDFFNGPGQQIRMTFSKGLVRAGKREMSLPTTESCYKKRKTITIERLFRPTKISNRRIKE